MKTIFTFIVLGIFSLGVQAQLVFPIDFELPEEDTAWTIFGNAKTSPEPRENFELVDNPAVDLNISEKCIKFTLLETADPWGGAYSDYYPDAEITSDNHMMYMYVYKDVISDVGMKLELGSDPAAFEVKIPNTVTDMWELLTFDMSDGIGNIYPRVTIFPDFPAAREAGSVTYIDYISFTEPEEIISVKQVRGEFFSIYPNPATEMITVQYPGMTNIQIRNIVGQTVKNRITQSDYIEKVNISDLKAGIYFVTVDTPDGIATSKFMKK
jgi:hypothetical protein